MEKEVEWREEETDHDVGEAILVSDGSVTTLIAFVQPHDYNTGEYEGYVFIPIGKTANKDEAKAKAIDILEKPGLSRSLRSVVKKSTLRSCV